MNGLRKPGRIAGLWFVATFVFSIPAVLLYDPVLNDADYILGGGLDARISMGALLEILLAISNIATAVVFYPVLKRVNEAVALGYVASRIIESAAIITGLMSLMTVVTLRDDFSGTARRFSPAQHRRPRAGRLPRLDVPPSPAVLFGFGNGLLLGYLMYKSALVPRKMAILGLIGGPLAFIGGVLALFGVIEDPSGALFAFTLVEIAWELSLAIYLTVNGYRPSPLLAETSPV